MRKIEILNKDKQLLFDNPPSLTTDEQKNYFTLPNEIKQWTKNFSTPTNLVGFILLWGYIRCSGRFFSKTAFLESDIQYICTLLTLSRTNIDLTAYKQRTYNYHKQIIRKYLQIQPFDTAAIKFFTENIYNRIIKHLSPVQILYEVAEICRISLIEVPSYNRFTTVISREISKFEISLTSIIKSLITPNQQQLFDQLTKLKSDNYRLTQLKNIDHDRSPAKIRESVKDFQLVQEIYKAILPIIKALGLHCDTIKHYATWVRKANNFQILQLNPHKKYLYLVCFIQHQYYIRQDILADILLLSVKSTQNAVEKEQKNIAYQHTALHNQTINILATSRISYRELVIQIEEIVESAISDTGKIIKINQLLHDYRTQQPLDESIEAEIRQNLEELKRRDYYTILEDASVKLQNRVADILRYLEFEKNDSTIFKAIEYYQSKKGKVFKPIHIKFLSPNEIKSLKTGTGKFRVSLYKVLLYLHTANSLKAGIISLKSAYRYLSLENYLYPQDKWQKDKIKLLEDTQLSNMQNIDSLLVQLKQELDSKYIKTNININYGNNYYVKFDAKNRPIVATPKVDKPNTKSVASLFSECKYVPILKVLTDIEQVTDYLSCFRHLIVKDKQVLPNNNVFYAAILGLGCNIGINKIASVSRGISQDVLVNLVNWHISLENIHLANKKVLEFMDKLTLTHIYRNEGQTLHTSSDGRKIRSAVESLNANSSYKYFGSGVGIVNYSFIDEGNRIFYATAISSAEREAAYVIDGLTHNPLIRSNIHSTDTHGYSEAIFAIMYLLGIYFAPRIKGLKRATLYGFNARKNYEVQGFKILPDRYIDEELIKSQWDNILRLVATIKLGENTASQIFRRLSSYSKHHPLYCALKEFGRIIKSIFILHYIDKLELRQMIEKQLNRIELSNKFGKAVSFDNNHEMLYRSKEEQDIAINCQRLIQNSIVLWNVLYLSQKIISTDDLLIRTQIVETVCNGSTQSWGHLNFNGEYDFRDDYLSDSEFELDKILSLQL